MTLPTERRAAAVTKVAGLLGRGVPLPAALRSVDAPPAAVALAEEGRPLPEALLAAGLVQGGEAALVRAAAAGPDAAQGLHLLAQELRAVAAIGGALRDALSRPLAKLVLGLALLALASALLGFETYLLNGPADRGANFSAYRGAYPMAGLSPGARVMGISALVIALGTAGLWLAVRTRPGLSLLERALRDAPLFGSLLACEVTARTLRVVGIGLAAGLDLATALERAREAFGRRAPAGELDGAIAAAREGQPLVACLARTPCADATAQWLAGVAAERADVPRELLALADLYEERLVRECAHVAPLLGGMADMLFLVLAGIPLVIVAAGVRQILTFF